MFYFTRFLGTTCLHALISFLLSGLTYLKISKNTLGLLDIDTWQKKALLGLVIYTATIFLVLGYFFCYNVYLYVGNVTSNESLRRKWNGSREGKLAKPTHPPSCCSRIAYIIWTEPDFSSRVEKRRADPSTEEDVLQDYIE